MQRSATLWESLRYLTWNYEVTLWQWPYKQLRTHTLSWPTLQTPLWREHQKDNRVCVVFIIGCLTWVWQFVVRLQTILHFLFSFFNPSTLPQACLSKLFTRHWVHLREIWTNLSAVTFLPELEKTSTIDIKSCECTSVIRTTLGHLLWDAAKQKIIGVSGRNPHHTTFWVTDKIKKHFAQASWLVQKYSQAK